MEQSPGTGGRGNVFACLLRSPDAAQRVACRDVVRCWSGVHVRRVGCRFCGAAPKKRCTAPGTGLEPGDDDGKDMQAGRGDDV